MKSIYHSHESISIFSLSCNLHLTGVLKLTHLSSDNLLKRAEELKSQNLRGSKSLLFSFPCRKSIQFAESWQLVVCIGNEFQFHFLLQDKFLFIGIINLINFGLLTFKQYSARRSRRNLNYFQRISMKTATFVICSHHTISRVLSW